MQDYLDERRQENALFNGAMAGASANDAQLQQLESQQQELEFQQRQLKRRQNQLEYDEGY